MIFFGVLLIIDHFGLKLFLRVFATVESIEYLTNLAVEAGRRDLFAA